MHPSRVRFRLENFLINDANGLLQQYRGEADTSRLARLAGSVENDP
jgi:hypothetical protein